MVCLQASISIPLGPATESGPDSGWPNASLQTHQVGAHFEVLDEVVHMPPSDSRCTQDNLNLISIHVSDCFCIGCCSVVVYSVSGLGGHTTKPKDKTMVKTKDDDVTYYPKLDWVGS